MIKVKQIVTGRWIEENCYLVYNDKNLLLVDPGNDAPILKEEIAKTGTLPVAILLTHTHYDHIGAVEELRSEYNIPVYVSPLEQDWLRDPEKNLSSSLSKDGSSNIIVRPTEFEFEIREYTLGNMTFDVVPTPGHSMGGLSFIFHEDRFVITGDSLFKGSIGRYDLYSGNQEQLLTGIQTQLFTLPDDYVAYPGHRAATTIGHEKATNPFFN